MNTDGRIHLGILFGGRSGEHEVSLMSARSILSVLDPARYAVTQIGITHDGTWLSGPNVLDAFASGNTADLIPVTLLPEPGHNCLYARRDTPAGALLAPLADLDVIFPVLHGTGGEDGVIQGLFELAGIAYIGAGVLASAVCMDKALCKSVLRAHQLPVLDSLVFTRAQIQDQLERVIHNAEAMADYPLYTKPANLGSSVGISLCRERAQLSAGLRLAARYDRRILVERGIEHPIEIEVSVLGNDQAVSSAPGEIRPGEDFYTYSAKYLADSTQLLVPAPLPLEVTKQIRRLAVEAYRAVDCAGMARVDFLIDPEGYLIYISELNTIPGFTSISMYPKLWQASGLDYPGLINRLIELALERKAEQDRSERRYGRIA